MTITVSGRTFDHKDRLKQLGGVWNSDEKNWLFYSATPQEIEQLKQLPGCLVTGDGETPRRSTELPKVDAFKLIIDSRETPKTRNGSIAIYGDDQTYLNYFKDKNPLAFFGFSNLGNMVKFIEEIPTEKRAGKRDAGWSGGENWHGTPNMSAAINLARDAWRDGVQNAARVLEFLNLEHATARRRSYAVAGGNVNVGRLLAGNPMHMIKRPKKPGRRVITLFVENTASAYINAENLIVRAAVVAAIADILERQGYSCAIVSVTMQAMSSSGSPGAQTAVTLKHAGERLNIDDVVFALGHPSFLRRFNFACVSQSDECRSIWSTQGFPVAAFNSHHPCGRNEFYVKHLSKNIPRGDLEKMALEMLPSIVPDGLPLEISGC
jgi:hypothetical protein